MKSRVLFIGLFAVFITSGFHLKATNDTLSLVRHGDSLFSIARYQEAGNYYQKASYYSMSSRNRITLLLKKIDCLKQIGKFSEAEDIISRTPTDDLSDTLLTQVLTQGALCSYLYSDFKKAESYLIALDYKLTNHALMNHSMWLYTLVLNEQNRWPEAKEKLLSFVRNNGSIDSLQKAAVMARVNDLYSPLNYPKLKNPDKARLMSQFIPGLGQMYAGYPLEGIGSLTMNMVVLAAAATGIYFQYYFTSVVVGNFFFAKFYTGNITRAEFLTNKSNYFKAKKYNAELKPEILRICK